MMRFTRSLGQLPEPPVVEGREVTAYAAVFDVRSDVVDHQGVYSESIAPGAFTKTLQERARHVGVFFNHGKTLSGTPSESASLPIGRPVSITQDRRGLLTVFALNKTRLADEVLESITHGDITGMSFGGRFVAQRAEGRAPWRPRADGTLEHVVRTEIALTEFGPTPMPAYPSAAILGVRGELHDLIDQMTEDEQVAAARALMIRADGLPVDTSTLVAAALRARRVFGLGGLG